MHGEWPGASQIVLAPAQGDVRSLYVEERGNDYTTREPKMKTSQTIVRTLRGIAASSDA